ncbi:sensor histidine kinase [Micrococcales bacterium 31B]|nr:sensor histidine kinase [Micrococcales bacterium 31B]
MVLLSWLAVFVGTVLMGAGVGVMMFADPDVIAVSGIVSVEQNLAPLAQFGAVQQRLLGAGAVVLGIVLVWLLSSSQRALAQTLLSATSKNQLSQQVHELGAARQGAVDAAEAERQRIERDLHDGAQPQLVALAMTLGLAQTAIKTDTRAAAALIDEAHAQAKQAITDLRQLARGIHPAVLTDRGLDAALSSIVARSPVACDLDVHLPTRAAPEIEAAAYFVVAEALTNVAKHSQASQASVQIYGNPGGITVSVIDNGRGGARVIEHQLGTSGLKGLADRVAATGGALRLHSPEGGPTHLSVAFPLQPSTPTHGLMTTCA